MESSRASLIESVENTLESSLGSIASVNTDLKVLSINAKIQAARVGALGAGFGVVANEMGNLASHTEAIIADLRISIKGMMNNLIELENGVRGQRLAQMAAYNIEIVDRSLYERSCDVRWWATDGAIVDAAMSISKGQIDFASQRMGVILDAYSVYFDIILCDMRGNILCNGRPGKYQCAGLNMGQTAWFNRAVAAKNGSEYGFEGPLTSALAGGKNTLVFSCGVRDRGQAYGKLQGVLGVVLNWDALGREVLLQTQKALSAEAEEPVKCYICRTDGVILSSTEAFTRDDKIALENLSNIIQSKFTTYRGSNGQVLLIGVGLSRGFEAYKTGWASIITEAMDRRDVQRHSQWSGK
ncbi:MAG: methyl-accepting chemotaxis protein [Treponema sp.]|nr:methyl-accepting chemotaxis protein [Treponema sp.]